MKKILLGVFLIAAGICILLGITNYSKKKRTDTDVNTFVENIRTDNKVGLDSLQKAINYENALNSRIQKSIADSDFVTAFHLMDSLPLFGKAEKVLLYQGSVLEKKRDYVNALKKYDLVIDNDKYSTATDDKARVLIKMNKLKEAINTYKIPFKWNNYDNALQIAEIFELIQNKDSALKFYKIYLEHYPNNLAVKEQILLIEKK